MLIVKHQPTMNKLKRDLAGLVSLGLGFAAIWLATASYRVGMDLAPVTGKMRGQDYAMIIALGGLGLIYLVIAYVFLVRSRHA